MSESGVCAWCGAEATTEVITVPGRVRKRTAPVCEEHARHFEGQGQMTTRLELEKRYINQEKRNNWVKRQRW